MNISTEDVERFWKKVNREGSVPEHMPELGKCWVWTGSRLPAGYGQFQFHGKPVKAHRFSWLLSHGQIPDGLYVCHRCDFPPCVNGLHLFTGTCKDNMVDCVNKGRIIRGDAHLSHLHPEIMPRGEGHGASKLTNAEVSQILRLYEDGCTQKELAARFHVVQQNIHSIVSRRTWRHITAAA